MKTKNKLEGMTGESSGFPLQCLKCGAIISFGFPPARSGVQSTLFMVKYSSNKNQPSIVQSKGDQNTRWP
jgi:hypothetical protein